MAKLITLLNVLILPKGYNKPISDFLHTSEIDCKCHNNLCHYTIYNPVAVEAFNMVRLGFGAPLNINSFYRCQSHNDNVGGVEKSSHTTGNAIDISFKGLTMEERSFLVELCEVHFDFIKIYPTFIHCQINPRNE